MPTILPTTPNPTAVARFHGPWLIFMLFASILFFLFLFLVIVIGMKCDEICHPPLKRKRAERKPKEIKIEEGMSLDFIEELFHKKFRLKLLTDRCRYTEVCPKAQGPRIHENAPAADDPRRPEGSNGYIILADDTCKREGHMVYGRSCTANYAPVGEELERRLATNKKLYLSKGPPHVELPIPLDMISVDSYPRYLYNIYVIDEKELEDMEKIIKPRFPPIFWDSEYFLLTAGYGDLLACRDCILSMVQELDKKYGDLRKKDKAEFLDTYASTETSGFEDLYVFYKFYKEYSKRRAAKFLLRMPVQGILLAAINCCYVDNLWVEKTLNWFRMVSMSVLRCADVHAINKMGAVMYPMNCMLKLRTEHDFGLMTDEEFKNFAIYTGQSTTDVNELENWEIDL